MRWVVHLSGGVLYGFGGLGVQMALRWWAGKCWRSVGVGCSPTLSNTLFELVECRYLAEHAMESIVAGFDGSRGCWVECHRAPSFYICSYVH